MTNSGSSPSKERIIGFFNKEVSMYILRDIDRLTNEIRPDKDTGLRGCTVPLAMMLFAVIDLFGYLTRDDENPRKTDTLGNFKYLMSEKANLFPKIYNDNYEKIVKLFRHGLIHQFFSKASGISKAGLGNPLIFESSGISNLNVDVLSKGVQDALEKIKKSIAENRDNNLFERMNSRLDKLAKEDYETLNSL
jgi:hypothetical protein